MKVILAGGGTGGHVYPSLAVASALRADDPGLDLLYIGIRGRVDARIVPGSGIPFAAVAAGPLRVASPLSFAANMLRLALGTIQSMAKLLRFRPDAVFATGGYASVPVGIAARVLRRPLVVFLPDVTPGWAVRLLSRLATRMTTTSEAALKHLPAGKSVAVGYPVRDEFWSLRRDEARARLGLPAAGTVLLVTGASLGARRINEAVFDALPRLVEAATLLHATGPADEREARERRDALPAGLRGRYVVQAYIDDMPAAMAAADLAVMRAGASVLGELPAAALPAVLVPGEYEGWSQAPNAEFMRDQGAAVMLHNAELGTLATVIDALLADPARLEAMRAATRALARPDAAASLARILREVAA